MKKSYRATYAKAGVGLTRADRWVELLQSFPKTPSPYRRYLQGGIGPFAATFALPNLKSFGPRPFILSTCDGVGTKLKFPSLRPQDLFVLGQDLVGMNVNDIAACGGTPVLFLDYLACGYLDAKKYAWVLKGIHHALRACGALLVGGETAEMPLCYKHQEFDLAGFCVGFAHPKKVFRPERTLRKGDILIGLPSNGVHSNGFSLVQHIFSPAELQKHASLFLRPTHLYAPVINHLLSYAQRPKGAAHITGGGLPGNMARVIPNHLCAVIDRQAWPPPPAVFSLIQKQGHISDAEMFRTFNMGIGFVLMVSQNHSDKILARCKKYFKNANVIGTIQKRTQQAVIIQ